MSFGKNCLIWMFEAAIKRKIWFILLTSLFISCLVFDYYVGRHIAPYFGYKHTGVEHVGTTFGENAVWFTGNSLQKDQHDGDLYNCNTSRTRKASDVEDLLCMQPPTFLPNYKNPCWYDEQPRRKLKCIPYFMLIGAPKSASTDVFDRMIKHPYIYGNNGIIEKEVLWWAWSRYGLARGFRKFKDLPYYFRTFSETTEKNKDENGIHTSITGDGASFTFQYLYPWKQIVQNKGLDEPRILTPHLIKHINPQTKFVLILREPTERLYSHYYFSNHKVATSERFSKNTDACLKKFNDCVTRHNTRKCAMNMTLYQEMAAMKIHLVYGIYSIFLREWGAVFPKEQFFIVRTEDYSKDIPGTLRDLYKFLGVEIFHASGNVPFSNEWINSILLHPSTLKL